MFASLVKKVTFTCPVCDTSITFNIHAGNDEIRELFSAISTLECPKCRNSLSDNATEIIRTIFDYNGAVSKLSALNKCSDFELD